MNWFLDRLDDPLGVLDKVTVLGKAGLAGKTQGQEWLKIHQTAE